MKTKVKICCIANQEEAAMAIAAGASAIGLVGPMPSGPGVIDNDTIATIAAHMPANIASFLLTSETTVAGIVQHHNITQTTTIQLVDTLPDRPYKALKAALPSSVQLVQVIHVLDESSIQEAIEIAPYVDYLLLDSGNPNLTVKELGGTGRTHNWAISKTIVQAVATPVFLAGGLNATNVAKAIEYVRPYGVDLCSGVRTNGRLDAEKLDAFFQAVELTHQ